MNDEARMSNDEIPITRILVLVPKLQFGDDPAFETLFLLRCNVSLSTLTGASRPSLPIGREDEMERRVTARASRWTTLNSYHSRERGFLFRGGEG
jgi:hypothetical protein